MNETIIEIVGDEPYEYVPMGDYVVRAAGVCGGRPTFKYTRIEVAGVLDQLAHGDSPEAIVAGYNNRVPKEALWEAIGIANRLFASYSEAEPLVAA